MSSTANFASVPKSPIAALSAANTNRDGATGTYVTLMTAGVGGSRIDRLLIKATGTTTAGMIRLFLGTAMIDEYPVVAITPAASIPTWEAEIVFQGGLVLQAGTVLKASTEKAEAFNVVVINGGDF